MNLWNTKSLAIKLKEGSLSPSERFKYFFIFILFTAFFMEVSLYIGQMPGVITLTESLIVIIITGVGTLLSYKINKAGDNKEFIDRYVCLSIPILIKLIVLLIGFYIIYLLVGYRVLGDTFDKYIDSTSWMDVLFTSLFELLFFWRLIHHMDGVSKMKPN